MQAPSKAVVVVPWAAKMPREILSFQQKGQEKKPCDPQRKEEDRDSFCFPFSFFSLISSAELARRQANMTLSVVKILIETLLETTSFRPED